MEEATAFINECLERERRMLALDYLGGAEATLGSEPSFRLLYARVLHQCGRNYAAIRQFKLRLEQGPLDTEDALTYARCWWLTGNAVQASVWARSAVETAAQNQSTVRNMSQTLHGKAESARELWDTVLATFSGAEARSKMREHWHKKWFFEKYRLDQLRSRYAEWCKSETIQIWMLQCAREVGDFDWGQIFILELEAMQEHIELPETWLEMAYFAVLRDEPVRAQRYVSHFVEVQDQAQLDTHVVELLSRVMQFLYLQDVKHLAELCEETSAWGQTSRIAWNVRVQMATIALDQRDLATVKRILDELKPMICQEAGRRLIQPRHIETSSGATWTLSFLEANIRGSHPRRRRSPLCGEQQDMVHNAGE
ncbi:hypothetical protein CALCODRAFT_558978 [Calocera cornea HHB12733]|uniref:Uncharacterized protein n=1 Tax=Calocera cornea HHB12733 TaxID=1353952 RepID=A0A165CG85_9BASI|nr:hypothetical protein CALCODRAFT_558978 [Calocera cornea HHB12733]